jgi:hypothetical protein
MWSKGCASSSVATAASPSNTATSRGSKFSRTILAITADRCGAISEGLMMAVLPAAMAEISGTKARFTG